MLNKSFLAKEVNLLNDSFFLNHKNQFSLSFDEWKALVESQNFIDEIKKQHPNIPLSTWQNSLADFTKIEPLTNHYTVFGIDGSQVYPDKHLLQIDCFLINTGYCCLDYAKQSKASLDSIPQIFHSKNLGLDDTSSLTDFVDLKREELEFEIAFKKSLEIRQSKIQKPFLCLFDGSLVFWHLESKKTNLKKYFLKKYLDWLNNFYEENILVASFLSLPKGRELINLVTAGTCNETTQAGMKIRTMINNSETPSDSDILENLLAENHRTTLLTSTSNIVKDYPEHLKPNFCYINIGQEIVRIETPAWIAKDMDKFNLICSMIKDQCIKGYGYPVALSEAHEQAVIKGPDRDLFYHLIYKKGINQKQKFVISQKNLKKRSMSV